MFLLFCLMILNSISNTLYQAKYLRFQAEYVTKRHRPGVKSKYIEIKQGHQSLILPSFTLTYITYTVYLPLN